MPKKIQDLYQYLQDLKTQVSEYRQRLDDLEKEARVLEFDFEIRKNDLLDGVNSSLRGFYPEDLDLELPSTRHFVIKNEDIDQLLAKMYQI